MSLSINYSRFKINVIIYAASIVSMMTSERQTATPAALARWLSGFEEIVKVLDKKSSFSENQVSRDPSGSVSLVILIILSTINQPSSKSSGFDESKRIIKKVFLSVPAL